MIRRDLENNVPSRMKPQYRGTTRRKGIDRKKTKRRCRACGADPAPNWFFCPTCHNVVSRYVHLES
jgi:hypothetical protein